MLSYLSFTAVLWCFLFHSSSFSFFSFHSLCFLSLISVFPYFLSFQFLSQFSCSFPALINLSLTSFLPHFIFFFSNFFLILLLFLRYVALSFFHSIPSFISRSKSVSFANVAARFPLIYTPFSHLIVLGFSFSLTLHRGPFTLITRRPTSAGREKECCGWWACGVDLRTPLKKNERKERKLCVWAKRCFVSEESRKKLNAQRV